MATPKFDALALFDKTIRQRVKRVVTKWNVLYNEVIAKPLFDSRVERVERVDLVKGVFWSERNAA